MGVRRRRGMLLGWVIIKHGSVGSVVNEGGDWGNDFIVAGYQIP